MEEDIRAFFVKILNSVSLIILWAFFTVAIGLYNNWLIPEKSWGWKQAIFYSIVIAAMIWIIRKMIKIWK